MTTLGESCSICGFQESFVRTGGCFGRFVGSSSFLISAKIIVMQLGSIRNQESVVVALKAEIDQKYSEKTANENYTYKGQSHFAIWLLRCKNSKRQTVIWIIAEG